MSLADQVIVSKEVTQAEQAKAQSIVILVMMLAQALGNPIYTCEWNSLFFLCPLLRFHGANFLFFSAFRG